MAKEFLAPTQDATTGAPVLSPRRPARRTSSSQRPLSRETGSRPARTNVLQSISWLMLGPLLRLVLAIPLAGFTAHHLGLAGYGEFMLAFSFAAMFGVLANFGLNDVLVRAVAQRPAEAQSLWASVFTFKLGLWIGYVGVVTSLAWALGYTPRLLMLVLLLSAMQGALSLDNSARAVFLGQQYAGVLGKIDIFKVALETTATITVLLVGYGAVMLAGVRFTTAGVMIACTFLVLVRRLHMRWRTPQLRLALALLPAGLRFASVSVVQAIYDRVGFLILGHVLGAQAVALVGAATVIIERMNWFLPSVLSVIFPVFSRLHVAARERLDAVFTRAFRYQTVLAVGCGLGVSVLGPWAIRLIFPAQFWTAEAIIRVLGWGCVAHLLASFCATVLQSLGKERQVSGIALLQCAVYLSTALLFIHSWGLMGFAWAYVTAETVAMMLYFVVLTRAGLLSEKHLRSMLLTLGAGMAVFGAVVLTPGSREHLAALLGLLLCYPLLLVLTRRISVEDMRYLHGVWTRETPAAV